MKWTWHLCVLIIGSCCRSSTGFWSYRCYIWIITLIIILNPQTFIHINIWYRYKYMRECVNVLACQYVRRTGGGQIFTRCCCIFANTIILVTTKECWEKEYCQAPEKKAYVKSCAVDYETSCKNNKNSRCLKKMNF